MSERPSNREALAATLSDLRSIAAWTLLVFGGIVFSGAVQSLGQLDGTAISLFFFTLCFVTAGAFVHPRFGPQLTKEYSLTEFGSIRSVDRRVLHPNEGHSKRCVMCDSQTTKGVIRRYREEFVVAGVPVYTLSDGKNHYCPDCATSDSVHDTKARSRTSEPVIERS